MLPPFYIKNFFLQLFSLIYFISTINIAQLKINKSGYYEVQGLNVMVFDDFYPEGHQGGLTIIQHGIRVAANGDLRLEPSPGQWSPVPKVGERKIDPGNGIITVELWYPDSSKDRNGFNPIVYPDLHFKYKIRTEAIGNSIKLTVDLENPVPDEWSDKIGFNLELFPGVYFGQPYLVDGKSGIFPRQANGPTMKDREGKLQIKPLAVGKELIISPGNNLKQIKFISNRNDLQLIDGRGLHNNGWFIVHSNMSVGTGKNIIEWIITPEIDTTWRYKPVVQVSQVGYHPEQVKFAVIELDKLTKQFETIHLMKINSDGESTVIQNSNPEVWGNFLRYKYLRFDFSDIKDEGLYKIKYGDAESNVFEIRNDIFSRCVWQPTLEYFLPVQMCHMRIEDRYKVWHGLCHMDDGLMAPVNHIHFDGYYQPNSTLTKFQPGDHIPGLNIGGWHDAGDFDLRIESQAGTVYKLSIAYEFFPDTYDETKIDQETRIVEIHEPDGIPDILQQIEHGILSIVNGYESMGRLYRGIISPTLEQYVHLGDASTMSDNLVFKKNEVDPVLKKYLPKDDRWVFTEKNSQRELYVARALAAAYRVLKDYNSVLSDKCLRIAEEIYNKTKINENNYPEVRNRINAAAELYLSKSGEEYKKLLLENTEVISRNVMDFSEVIGRLVKRLNEKKFSNIIEAAVKESFKKISEQQKENPYGVPYQPYIWGAGWGVQSFGVKQLFLSISFPEVFPADYVFNALNFILGVHPGENTSSFASGVGVNSLTVAYGVNRDEWSYIPGGIGSGTSLIRPDLPELKVWPYLWQQTEYIIGGGALDFMILAMAADHLFNQ